MTKTVIEQLVDSVESTKKFQADLLRLVMVQEFRHWSAIVAAEPKAAALDEEARNRVAAKTAVQVVAGHFDGVHREAFDRDADGLVEMLVRWATGRPKTELVFN